MLPAWMDGFAHSVGLPAWMNGFVLSVGLCQHMDAAFVHSTGCLLLSLVGS